MAKTVGTIFSLVMALVSVAIAILGIAKGFSLLIVVGAVLAVLFTVMTVAGHRG